MHLLQRTLAKPISCSGIGMHSGKAVNLTIHPAPANHGIKFRRLDLPGRPIISAHFNMVVDTSLATVIGQDGAIVSTIEHLMASFAGLGVDNALVEMDDYEVPIMDGSAEPFTSLMDAAGFSRQESPRLFFVVNAPIELKDGDRSVGVYPANSGRITYTIAFDHPLINQQTFDFEMSSRRFVRDICRARTFGFLKEVEYLKRYGFAKGGSLENAVVIDKEDVLNKEGLRYADEFVRHKILDSIGDFSLLGLPVLGHMIINKSGHNFNHAFLKKFITEKKAWETRAIASQASSPPPERQSKSLAI